LHGEPLGELCVALQQGRCAAGHLADAIVRAHGREIFARLLRGVLAQSGPQSGRIAQMLRTAPVREPGGALPALSIAICTRDRTALLAVALESLMRVEYPAPLER